MFIYCIENTINHKKYIGKTTKTVEIRYRQHCNNSKLGETWLYRAMRKHGISNFSVFILDTATSPLDLNKKEIYYIAKFKSEYNMTKGGDGGSDPSKYPKFLAHIAKGSPLKGRSYDNIHGKQKAEELKINRGKSNTQREHTSSSIAWHKKQGKTLSERYRAGTIKIGKGLTKKITCSGCNKTTNPGNIARWHKNC